MKQKQQLYSFVPAGQKPLKRWQWRFLLLPGYGLLLVWLLITTLLGVGTTVAMGKLVPSLIPAFNKYKPAKKSTANSKKQIFRGKPIQAKPMATKITKETLAETPPPTKKSLGRRLAWSISWHNLVPITLSLTLLVVIGGMIWWLSQPVVARESTPAPTPIITEQVDLALPDWFAGCENFDCSTLPLAELEHQQYLLRQLAQQTQSARIFLNLALTYFYQGDETKYQEYLELAQNLDPSVRFSNF